MRLQWFDHPLSPFIMVLHPLSQLSFRAIQAKFNGRCASTGLAIVPGERIAYEPTTRQMHKLFWVNPGIEDFRSLWNVQTPLWKFVEALFDRWLTERSGHDWDVRAMYEGPDAIYDRRGAIQQALEEASNYADETGTAVALHTFDLDCIWSA